MELHGLRGSAGIEPVGGDEFASVSVEVVPSDTFHIKCGLEAPIEVEAVDGTVNPAGIEIACMSGARYARHVLPLAESTVVIRGAVGRIALANSEGFSIATVLAIGRALGRENQLPAAVFQGAAASWRPVGVPSDPPTP
ncbi:MAG TPA: hypothetical protein VHY91_27140 [Pirellulales bacterium]|jgi:hypothetical protein|nr:hypothetical protein [Pirellulales bacterium]